MSKANLFLILETLFHTVKNDILQVSRKVSLTISKVQTLAAEEDLKDVCLLLVNAGSDLTAFDKVYKLFI